MIEYFDVVDTKDRPTGAKTTYKESHSSGIIHRCAAVFVFNQAGELYIQKRHAKSTPHLDHTVGGHVSAGEDYLTAAIREAEEEVNLTEKLTPVITSLYSDELFNPAFKVIHMFGVFECTPSESWKFQPNEEVQEIYPESLENIVKQMMESPGRFAPGFINTLDAYIKHKSLDIKFDAQKCRENWVEL
jgi:16S rRNA (adenine1518-N6/adenine1519-N6)-dimethyltransferase